MLLMRERVNYDDTVEDDASGTEEEEVAEAPQDGSAPQPPKPKKTLMKAILNKNHIVEVPNTEDEEECVLKNDSSVNFHQHILPMLLDGANRDVEDRVRHSPSFLGDAIVYFLKMLRLF
jgi:hypothetical protein